jgi:limonene-1,2-epoxide hydrolase
MTAENKILTDVERVNAQLTKDFCDAWSAADCDRLLTYLADDVAYMVYDGGPVHVGHAAVDRAVRPFMANFEQIDFKILRLNVMGRVVTHERTEDYVARGDKDDTFFHVVGLLVIRDGKVETWRDYALPGARQIIGGLSDYQPSV